MSNQYWRICAEGISDEMELSLPSEKLDQLADLVSRAAEMETESCGHQFIPNPDREEIERLQKLVILERSKVTCKECSGTGRYVSNSGPWQVSGNCHKCHGEGRHKP